MTEVLTLSAIHLDGGTQPRASINDTIVEDYAADMQAGAVFPPIIVFFDGKDYWLADGFHRVRAARLCGWKDLPADIRQGTRREAVLFSVGANAEHGLRRSNTDKRRAVETLLRDVEWRDWSDNLIAEKCGVSQPFVGKVRAEIYPPAKVTQTPGSSATYNGYKSNESRKGADGRVINTAGIGRSNGHARVGGASDTSEATDPPSPDDTLPEPGGKGAEVRAQLAMLGINAVRVVAHKDGTFTAGFEPTNSDSHNDVIALLRAGDMTRAGWQVIEARDGCVADNDQTGRPIVIFRALAPLADRQRDVLRGIHLNLSKRPDGFLKRAHIERHDLHLVDSMAADGTLLEAKREGVGSFAVVFYRLTDAALTALGIPLPAAADDTADPDALSDLLLEDEYEPAEMRSVVTSFPNTPITPAAPNGITTSSDGSESNEWYTPSWAMDLVREVFGENADLDPASSLKAQLTVQAKQYFTKEMNGLLRDWFGKVFLNPPYSRGEGTSKLAWVRKLLEEIRAGRVTELILLITASPGTQWFQKLWGNPICFVDGRIVFDTPDLTEAADNDAEQSGKFDSVFVYFGPNPERFIEVFSRIGEVTLTTMRNGQITAPVQMPEAEHAPV